MAQAREELSRGAAMNTISKVNTLHTGDILNLKKSGLRLSNALWGSCLFAVVYKGEQHDFEKSGHILVLPVLEKSQASGNRGSQLDLGTTETDIALFNTRAGKGFFLHAEPQWVALQTDADGKRIQTAIVRTGRLKDGLYANRAEQKLHGWIESGIVLLPPEPGRDEAPREIDRAAIARPTKTPPAKSPAQTAAASAPQSPAKGTDKAAPAQMRTAPAAASTSAPITGTQAARTTPMATKNGRTTSSTPAARISWETAVRNGVSEDTAWRLREKARPPGRNLESADRAFALAHQDPDQLRNYLGFTKGGEWYKEALHELKMASRKLGWAPAGASP